MMGGFLGWQSCILPGVCSDQKYRLRTILNCSQQSGLFVSLDLQVLVTCCGKIIGMFAESGNSTSSTVTSFISEMKDNSGWQVRSVCVRPTQICLFFLWLLRQICLFLALSAAWGFHYAHQPVLLVGFLCPAHVPSVEWQLKKYLKPLWWKSPSNDQVRPHTGFLCE